MTPTNPSKELLDLIRKRPGMLWGGGDHPFTSLIAFLNGYKVGSRNVVRPEELLPLDFDKFVTERFGKKYPDGGRGWMTFIQEHAASEQEAFEMFFQLREEYDRTR